MQFKMKDPITKGWSADKKYHVTDDNDKEYLLRISPAERADRKRKSFEMMQLLAGKGIPMCGPIAFGECKDGVYYLQSWIKGRDAKDVLPGLPKDQQYAYGLEAGRILKKIHCIPAPADIPPWEERFQSKIDRKIKLYNECELKYENGEAFIRYIEENRHLLKNRKQVYQHGDYHIGNMMIDENGRLSVLCKRYR